MKVNSMGESKKPIVITYPQAVCCQEVTTTNRMLSLQMSFAVFRLCPARSEKAKTDRLAPGFGVV